MAFSALYSLYLSGKLFISAIALAHHANKFSKFEACSASQFANTPGSSTNGLGSLVVGIGQEASSLRYEAFKNAAIGGLLMYSACSTVSTLIAGNNFDVAPVVVNAGIALLGVNNIFRSI